MSASVMPFKRTAARAREEEYVGNAHQYVWPLKSAVLPIPQSTPRKVSYVQKVIPEAADQPRPKQVPEEDRPGGQEPAF